MHAYAYLLINKNSLMSAAFFHHLCRSLSVLLELAVPSDWDQELIIHSSWMLPTTELHFDNICAVCLFVRTGLDVVLSHFKGGRQSQVGSYYS